MKQFTLGEAAKASGKSKSTIFRAVKAGKISATREGDEYRIDASELFRVFPSETTGTVHRNDTQLHSDTVKDAEIKGLQALLDAKEQLLDEKQKRIETLENSLRLLERLVPEKSPVAEAPAPQARSLFSRIFKG